MVKKNKNGYWEGDIGHSNLISRKIAYSEIYRKNRAKYTLRFRDYVVHHIDGEKANNSIRNLKLLTPEEHELLHKLLLAKNIYIRNLHLHSWSEQKQLLQSLKQSLKPKSPKTYKGYIQVNNLSSSQMFKSKTKKKIIDYSTILGSITALSCFLTIFLIVTTSPYYMLSTFLFLTLLAFWILIKIIKIVKKEEQFKLTLGSLTLIVFIMSIIISIGGHHMLSGILIALCLMASIVWGLKKMVSHFS